jgi:hypothetical protein
MRIFSALILLFLFVSAMPQAEAQKKNGFPSAKSKKQALAAGLKIVESYFEGDCKTDFLPVVHTTVFTLDGDGAVEINEEMKERLCETHERAVKDKTRTYQDYLANYDVQILTKPEYEKLLGKIDFDYYTAQEQDLLFVGSVRKADAKLENFIFDDFFYFMLRKINKEWKIIAVSG